MDARMMVFDGFIANGFDGGYYEKDRWVGARKIICVSGGTSTSTSTSRTIEWIEVALVPREYWEFARVEVGEGFCS